MLSSKDKQGLWVIVTVVILLIIVLVVKGNLDNKPKPGLNNCTGDVTANTVVVLDYSQQITNQTREEITARAMMHIHGKVKINELVSVFTISEFSKKSLQPLVSLCRPPEDGNRAIENVQQIRKFFQKNFEIPLREALSGTPGESKESPIAQVITDISLSQYLRGKSNTLIIFSDMLENTSKFSLYKCDSQANVIAQYRESRRGALERPELKNTSVSLNIIPRLDLTKGSLICRDKLWTWFFGNNEGPQAGVSLDYLPGGVSMGSTVSGLKK
ncbi:MAG: hypothetical protein WCS87_11650 [Methylococcaceae bacterium]